MQNSFICYMFTVKDAHDCPDDSAIALQRAPNKYQSTSKTSCRYFAYMQSEQMSQNLWYIVNYYLKTLSP